MEFRILGPLEVRSSDLPVRLAGPRQCALLTYLLLHANEVVPTERVLEDVWFELPQGGVAAVQTQVSRLRQIVGDHLVTSGHAYMLRVAPGELDLHRLRELLAQAGAAASVIERSRLLHEAESLWRGDPLIGLDAPFVAGEAAALDELRYAALEERLAADLERGLTSQLLSEIALHVSRRPTRERLRMMQMLALYRAGRQADALEAYRSARETLDAELGLEPSTAMRELERAILRQDPSLDAAAPAASPAGGAPPPASVRRRRAVLATALLGVCAVAGTGTALVLTHSTTDRAAVTTRPAPRERRATIARRDTTTGSVSRISATTTRARRPPPKLQPKPKREPPPKVVTAGPVVVVHTTTGTRPPITPTHTTTTSAPATTATRATTLVDRFAGTRIDWTTWYQIATGSGWSLSQNDGSLEYVFDADATPGGQYDQIGGHLGTQCKFPGDFDARVDFALPQWPARNGVVVNLWAFLSNVGYAAWRQSNPQWGEAVGGYVGAGASGGIPYDDASGSLRLARRRGVLTAYFLHNGAWRAVTAAQRPGLATIAIGANAGNDFGGQPVVVDLRNFSVTGDDPVCPPGARP